MHSHKNFQVKQFGRLLENAGIDPDTVDLKAEIDSQIGFHENLDHIEGLLGRSLTKIDHENGLAMAEDYHSQKLLEDNPDIREYMENEWGRILRPPCAILVLGRRGKGKSALCYWLLELISKKYGLEAFVLGLPKEKRDLLPDTITPLDIIEDLPEGACILIDEASLRFYAKSYNTTEAKLMDQIVSVSRQKGQVLIFATHTARKFQATLLLDMDALIFKEPSLLHSKMERQETKDLTRVAREHFAKINEEDRVKYAYVVSENYEGMLKNPLVSWWSEDLSEAWAGLKFESKKVRTHLTDKELRNGFRDRLKHKKVKRPKDLETIK